MKIRLISADLFSFDEVLDWKHPMSVRIEFSDNVAIRIRGASDGASIVVDDHPLNDPVDMAEYGKTEIHDLTERLGICTSSPDIVAVNKIIDANNIVVGLALLSVDGPVLCVWNYGDELYYGSFAEMVEYDWGERPQITDAEVSLR